VVERTLPRKIARGDDALRRAVPNHEGEVALEMRGAVRAPRAIGRENEMARRLPRRDDARAREGGAEIVAIVDARVGRDRDLAVDDDERVARHRGRELPRLPRDGEERAGAAPDRDAIIFARAHRRERAANGRIVDRCATLADHRQDDAHA
jgi:hypothetical protein